MGCLDIPPIKAGRELTHSYAELVCQSGMTSHFSQEGLELHCLIYSNIAEEKRNHNKLSVFYFGSTICFRKRKRNYAFPNIKIIYTHC